MRRKRCDIEINKFDSWVGIILLSDCRKKMWETFCLFLSSVSIPCTMTIPCLKSTEIGNSNYEVENSPLDIMQPKECEISGWTFFDDGIKNSGSLNFLCSSLSCSWAHVKFIFYNVSCRWLLGWRKRNWLKSTPQHLAPFQTSQTHSQEHKTKLQPCIYVYYVKTLPQNISPGRRNDWWISVV